MEGDPRYELQNRIRSEIKEYNSRYWSNFWYFVGISIIIGLAAFFLLNNPNILFISVPSALVIFCARFGFPKTVSFEPEIPMTNEPHKPYSDALDQIYCRHCGAKTDIGEIFCPKCHRSLK